MKSFKEKTIGLQYKKNEQNIYSKLNSLNPNLSSIISWKSIHFIGVYFTLSQFFSWAQMLNIARLAWIIVFSYYFLKRVFIVKKFFRIQKKYFRLFWASALPCFSPYKTEIRKIFFHFGKISLPSIEAKHWLNLWRSFIFLY